MLILREWEIGLYGGTQRQIEFLSSKISLVEYNYEDKSFPNQNKIQTKLLKTFKSVNIELQEAKKM